MGRYEYIRFVDAQTVLKRVFFFFFHFQFGGVEKAKRVLKVWLCKNLISARRTPRMGVFYLFCLGKFAALEYEFMG